MSDQNWTDEQPIVSIKDVYKSFGSLEVLKGISMDIMKGEVICIIGPSGSGKSTLIRCINALNDIQRGAITLQGQDVHEAKLDKLELRKKVGMVFQQYNLFPHKTALENVMMAPLKVLKESKGEVEKRARALIKKVRLEGKENSYPGELSGGRWLLHAKSRTTSILRTKVSSLNTAHQTHSSITRLTHGPRNFLVKSSNLTKAARMRTVYVNGVYLPTDMSARICWRSIKC